MADKTKIWGAIPWWIFSWGGRAGASPRLYSQILSPPRLTRNLLLILITPREWIGRNIRQIDLSYIFYLHIPVTESQAHFLSLYFFICFRGSWGCSTPLGLRSRLWAGCSHQSWGSLSRREGVRYGRIRGLCSSRLRLRRNPFSASPSLFPAAHLISSELCSWRCACPCGDGNTVWPSLQGYYRPDTALCAFACSFPCF